MSDGDCCENIDECFDVSLNLCPAVSHCQDNDGSYFCDCDNTLDYVNETVNQITSTWTCDDKNECADASWNGCDSNSVCENKGLVEKGQNSRRRPSEGQKSVF